MKPIKISFYGAVIYNKNMFHCVYILENQTDKSLYIGYTTNLRRRVNEHNEGKGGKTTKNKLHSNLSRSTATEETWKLIYFEGYLIKQDALGREKFLKSGSGRKYINKQLTNYLSK